MDSHTVLVVLGALLIVAAIVLVIPNCKDLGASVVALATVGIGFGSLLAIDGSGNLKSGAVKAAGTEISFEMEQIKEKVDLAPGSAEIGGINLQINEIQKALKNQEDYNKSIKQALEELKAQPPNLENPQTKTSEFVHNGTFTVFIAYRHSRENDAEKIETALLNAGFKASKKSTNLREAKIPEPPAGSTVVIPTERGAESLSAVHKIANLALPEARRSALQDHEVYPLLRGDLQILLY